MNNPLEQLKNIHNTKAFKKAKQEAATLLQTTPEALETFEKTYRNRNNAADGALGPSHHAIKTTHKNNHPTTTLNEELIHTIVQELLAQTTTYHYPGHNKAPTRAIAAPAPHTPIDHKELNKIPETHRPQCTGTASIRDLNTASYPLVLKNYQRYLTTGSERDYLQFIQGLDISDLDPVLYEMLSMNQNSMSHWFPPLVEANNKHRYFHLPETTIAKVPIDLLQLSRIEYTLLNPTTLRILDEWAYQAFGLDDTKDYFVKTGTFSSKFDFRNAHVTAGAEVHDLGEYLMLIQNQAVKASGPNIFGGPSIPGMSTTNEWVVREYIPNQEEDLTIYNGLPLRTEYRVFVDCEENTVLGISPYWKPEVMHERFNDAADSTDPNMIHDAVTYMAHESVLMGRYENNKGTVIKHIEELLPDLNLTGQWSIDVMEESGKFWIIDMATAHTSALKECVPANLLKNDHHSWIPQLETNHKN